MKDFTSNESQAQSSADSGHTTPTAVQVEQQPVAHTPEPWRAVDVTIETIGGQHISSMGDRMICAEEDFANAKRAVIAVNAVASISNEALENGMIGEMRECLKEALRLRSLESNIVANPKASSGARAQYRKEASEIETRIRKVLVRTLSQTLSGGAK